MYCIAQCLYLRDDKPHFLSSCSRADWAALTDHLRHLLSPLYSESSQLASLCFAQLRTLCKHSSHLLPAQAGMSRHVISLRITAAGTSSASKNGAGPSGGVSQCRKQCVHRCKMGKCHAFKALGWRCSEGMDGIQLQQLWKQRPKKLQCRQSLSVGL